MTDVRKQGRGRVIRLVGVIKEQSRALMFGKRQTFLEQASASGGIRSDGARDAAFAPVWHFDQSREATVHTLRSYYW